MIDFYAGQKVVCVDDEFLGADEGIITEGHVYTIRSVGRSQLRSHPARHESPCSVALCLEGIRRGNSYPELGFFASRFRPLIETDISIFQAILTSVPSRPREIEPSLASQPADQTRQGEP